MWTKNEFSVFSCCIFKSIFDFSEYKKKTVLIQKVAFYSMLFIMETNDQIDFLYILVYLKIQ
jgi:hypothetical protein